jgi:hypothetical protein
MERMPRAKRSATLSTRIFFSWRPASLSGTESVATTSLMGDLAMRSIAGPDAACAGYKSGAFAQQCPRFSPAFAVSMMSSIISALRPARIADQVHPSLTSISIRRLSTMASGARGKSRRAYDAAGIRRDDGDVSSSAGENVPPAPGAEQMIHRHIKYLEFAAHESSQCTAGARGFRQVRDESWRSERAACPCGLPRANNNIEPAFARRKRV